MFVTDAILATLMCATRSQYSWDIVVDKIGGKVGKSKKLYTGTLISDVLKLCTVLCGRNTNKPCALTEVEGNGLKLWCDIAVQQKTSYIKLERILFGFLVIWKIQKQYISLKNDMLPLNSLFWSPPTAVHRFDRLDTWGSLSNRGL